MAREKAAADATAAAEAAAKRAQMSKEEAALEAALAAARDFAMDEGMAQAARDRATVEAAQRRRSTQRTEAQLAAEARTPPGGGLPDGRRSRSSRKSSSGREGLGDASPARDFSDTSSLEALTGRLSLQQRVLATAGEQDGSAPGKEGEGSPPRRSLLSPSKGAETPPQRWEKRVQRPSSRSLRSPEVPALPSTLPIDDKMYKSMEVAIRGPLTLEPSRQIRKRARVADNSAAQH